MINLLLVIIVCIISLSYSKIIQPIIRVTQDKCEDVVYDPITLRKVPIFSEKGNEIFKSKLIYYLDQYLKNTKDDWNYVVPEEFNKMDKSDLFILDVRKPEDYKKGHIKNSLNIFWLDLMEKDNLSKIPKDNDIILVCYVGHTASQVLVLLKLLGYKARVLKFGMGKSPTKGVPVAGWTNFGYDITNL